LQDFNTWLAKNIERCFKHFYFHILVVENFGEIFFRMIWTLVTSQNWQRNTQTHTHSAPHPWPRPKILCLCFSVLSLTYWWKRCLMWLTILCLIDCPRYSHYSLVLVFWKQVPPLQKHQYTGVKPAWHLNSLWPFLHGISTPHDGCTMYSSIPWDAYLNPLVSLVEWWVWLLPVWISLSLFSFFCWQCIA
jgi:hypothetical protein